MDTDGQSEYSHYASYEGFDSGVESYSTQHRESNLYESWQPISGTQRPTPGAPPQASWRMPPPQGGNRPPQQPTGNAWMSQPPHTNTRNATQDGGSFNMPPPIPPTLSSRPNFPKPPQSGRFQPGPDSSSFAPRNTQQRFRMPPPPALGKPSQHAPDGGVGGPAYARDSNYQSSSYGFQGKSGEGYQQGNTDSEYFEDPGFSTYQGGDGNSGSGDYDGSMYQSGPDSSYQQGNNTQYQRDSSASYHAGNQQDNDSAVSYDQGNMSSYQQRNNCYQQGANPGYEQVNCPPQQSYSPAFPQDSGMDNSLPFQNNRCNNNQQGNFGYKRGNQQGNNNYEYQQGNNLQENNNYEYQQGNNNSGYQRGNNSGYQQGNNNSGYQQESNNSGYQGGNNSGYQRENNNSGYQQGNNNFEHQRENNISGYQGGDNSGYQGGDNSGYQEGTSMKYEEGMYPAEDNTAALFSKVDHGTGMNVELDDFYASIDKNVSGKAGLRTEDNFNLSNVDQQSSKISSSTQQQAPYGFGEGQLQSWPSKRDPESSGLSVKPGPQEADSATPPKDPMPADKFADDDTDYCKLCNIYFTSAPMYAFHVRGVTHIQRMLAVNSGLSRSPAEKPFIVSGKTLTQALPQVFENPVTEALDVVTQKLTFEDIEELNCVIDSYCKVCEVYLDTEQIQWRHVAGKRHLAAIQAVMEGGTLPEVVRKKKHGDDIMKVATKELDKDSNFGKALASVPSWEPVVGLAYVLEIIKEDDETTYACELCNTECTIANMVSHIIGFKHRVAFLRTRDKTRFLSMAKKTKRAWRAETVRGICKDIETKYGRGTIRFNCTQSDVKDRMPKKDAEGFWEEGEEEEQMFDETEEDPVESLGQELMKEFQERNIEPEIAQKMLDCRMEHLVEYKKHGVPFDVAREQLLRFEERRNLLLEFEHQALTFKEAERRIDRRLEMVERLVEKGWARDEATGKVLSDEALQDFKDDFTQLGLPREQAQKMAERRLWMLQTLHLRDVTPEDASRKVMEMEREVKVSLRLAQSGRAELKHKRRQRKGKVPSEVTTWMVVGEEIEKFIVSSGQQLGLSSERCELQIKVALDALDRYKEEDVPPDEAKCRVLINDLAIPCEELADSHGWDVSANELGSNNDISCRVQQFKEKFVGEYGIVSHDLNGGEVKVVDRDKHLVNFDEQSRLETQKLLSDMIDQKIVADEARKKLVILYKKLEHLREELFSKDAAKISNNGDKQEESKEEGSSRESLSAKDKDACDGESKAGQLSEKTQPLVEGAVETESMEVQTCEEKQISNQMQTSVQKSVLSESAEGKHAREEITKAKTGSQPSQKESTEEQQQKGVGSDPAKAAQVSETSKAPMAEDVHATENPAEHTSTEGDSKMTLPASCKSNEKQPSTHLEGGSSTKQQDSEDQSSCTKQPRDEKDNAKQSDDQQDSGKQPTADDRWNTTVEMFLQQYNLKSKEKSSSEMRPEPSPRAERYSPSYASPRRSEERRRRRSRSREYHRRPDFRDHHSRRRHSPHRSDLPDRPAKRRFSSRSRSPEYARKWHRRHHSRSSSDSFHHRRPEHWPRSRSRSRPHFEEDYYQEELYEEEYRRHSPHRSYRGREWSPERERHPSPWRRHSPDWRRSPPQRRFRERSFSPEPFPHHSRRLKRSRSPPRGIRHEKHAPRVSGSRYDDKHDRYQDDEEVNINYMDW